MTLALALVVAAGIRGSDDSARPIPRVLNDDTILVVVGGKGRKEAGGSDEGGSSCYNDDDADMPCAEKVMTTTTIITWLGQVPLTQPVVLVKESKG